MVNPPLDPADAIAVIGLAGRFPGTGTIAELRQAALTGRALFEPAFAGAPGDAAAGFVNCGAFLKQDITTFDAGFFGLSARRAQTLDPQHRLFLECAWEALESAGFAAGAVEQRVSVFGGSSANAYLLDNIMSHRGSALFPDDGEIELGGNKDHLALFTAYAMQLTGMAVTVQSCCSTSLLAVHLAVRSLREGECDIALAGGVSLRLPAGRGYHPRQTGIQSPSGRCRPFDAAADGTIFASGAGVVALQRLDEALADGSQIHAVILGSAANNDGGAKSTYTAPSARGQREVLAEALADARVDPAEVGFVETHGTGTRIGDPIEFEALNAVYGGKADGAPCYLGAIKANIGHLDVASGIAGLISAVTTLREGTIAPIAGLEQPNPLLRLENSNLRFARTASTFPLARPLAAVSSFGIGGTNVHLVLGPPPGADRQSAAQRPPGQALEFPLSAQTHSAAAEAARRLADYLEANPEIDLAAVAHTLQHGRRHMAVRCCIRAASPGALIAQLRALPTAAVDRQERPEAARYLDGSDDAFDAGAAQPGMRRLALPTYPFERQRYWIDPAVPASPAQAAPADDNRAVRARRVLDECCPQPLTIDSLGLELLEAGFDSLSLAVLSERLQQVFDFEISFSDLIAEGYTPERLIRTISDAASGRAAPAGGVAGAPSSDAEQVLPAAANEPDKGAAHGPFVGQAITRDARLTPRQQAFVDDLVQTTVARARRSRGIAGQGRSALADPRTIAGFDPRWKGLCFPLVADRSAGSGFVDIDGNSYVDMIMGFGANYLGHAPPYVSAAVARELERGYPTGPQTELAHMVAAQICELTGCERVAFSNTGSEAVTGALRIARAATRRSAFAIFAGSYHGGSDPVLARKAGHGDGGSGAIPIAPGIPASALAESHVLDYGQDSALDYIARNGEQLAAVLVEPVQSRNPALVPTEFLHRLRALCDRLGILLVFDEVITGFRCHIGGAQALFGVRADLCTYGKVIGGGLPIGAIAGRAALMAFLDGGDWRYDDQSIPDNPRTFFAGTFVRHPLAMAAAHAALGHIADCGPELQISTTRRVSDLRERINARLANMQAGIELDSFASFMAHRFAPDLVLPDLLFPLLRSKGIYALEGRLVHLSTVHTEADMQRIEQGYADAVQEMLQAGLLAAG